MLKNSKIIIAFVLVVLIMGHSFTSYAADGGSNGEIIATYYSIPSDSSIVALNSSNIFASYSGDISAISGSNPWRMGAGSWSDSTFHDVLNNRFRFSTIEFGGTVYDTSTYNLAITPFNYNSSNGFIYMMFGSDSPVVFVDGYAVSQSPIIYVCGYYQYSNNSLLQIDPFSPLVSEINSASDNGLYCVAFRQGYDYPCPNFTNMPVYISSSDGDTGFETFTSASTDFSFDNLESYHNFNIQMTNNMFTDPNVPVPDEGLDMTNLIEKNAYANLTAYISGYNDSSCQLHMNFSLPEFIRHNPQYYSVNVRIRTSAQAENSNHDYGLHVFENVYTIPMTAIVGYGGRTPVNNTVSGVVGNFNQLIDFDDLLENERSLSDYLADIWAEYSNSTISYYRDGDVISYGGSNPSGGSNSFGGYQLNPNIDHFASTMFAQIKIVSSTGYQTGSYYTTFNLLTGEQSIMQNEIGVRPDSNGDPEYIVVEKEGSSSPSYGGPVAYGYGGSVGNITINSGEQYKYTISAGSVEAYNGMIDDIKEEMAGLSDNNFFQIMGRTLGFIPSAFWYYLALGSGVIVFSAIVRFVLRR